MKSPAHAMAGLFGLIEVRLDRAFRLVKSACETTRSDKHTHSHHTRKLRLAGCSWVLLP